MRQVAAGELLDETRNEAASQRYFIFLPVCRDWKVWGYYRLPPGRRVAIVNLARSILRNRQNRREMYGNLA